MQEKDPTTTRLCAEVPVWDAGGIFQSVFDAGP